MPSQQTNEKYTAHILECASIAQQVAQLIGLRDDSARQACFATVCIDAKGHGVFLEPVPPHTKTPVEGNGQLIQSLKDHNAKLSDEAAAKKADAQIADVPQRKSTAEEDAGARRTSLLSGINSARDLLVKEGYQPLFTPKYMNEFIKEKMKIDGNLGTLDVDELATLIELLNKTLDTYRHNKKAMDAEPPF